MTAGRTWWLRWGPVAAYAALIFVASSLPFGAPNPRVFNLFTLDKLIHAAEFGLLAALLARALETADGTLTGKMVLLAIILAAVYGALDELHQHFTPNRYPDLDDGIADAIGAALGALCWLLILRRFPRVRWARGDATS